MITIQNYQEKVKNIDFKTAPEAIAKGDFLVDKAKENNWEAYKENATIKRVIDAYFLKLDAYIKTISKPNKPVTTEKKSVTPKQVPKSKAKTDSSKSTKRVSNWDIQVEIRKASEHSTKFIVWDIAKKQPFANEKFDSFDEAKEWALENRMVVQTPYTPTPTKSKTKLVEKITSDVQFIRRYIALDGKVKTEAQILGLLSSLQRAILEKRISKTSPHASIINTMQEQLIYAYENMGKQITINIEPKNLEKYKAIAQSEKGLTSIQLLKSFVSLHGKTGVLEKAKKLAKRMDDAVRSERITCNDPYKTQINSAYTKLQAYIKKKSKVIELTQSELNGLECLDTKQGVGQVISSAELLNMQFETIGLRGKFRDLIGDPSVGFLAMVFGLPKSGKSTFCIEFASYLAKHHGKVLYCAEEEGFGYTFKEKIQRLGASHPRLFIAEKIPSNLSQYDFVFIDSVSRAGLELEDIKTLRKRHPRTAFIFIYHTTKEGKFRGGNDHAHEVDTIIQVEKGRISNSGRFNQGGTMELAS